MHLSWYTSSTWGKISFDNDSERTYHYNPSEVLNPHEDSLHCWFTSIIRQSLQCRAENGYDNPISMGPSLFEVLWMWHSFLFSSLNQVPVLKSDFFASVIIWNLKSTEMLMQTAFAGTLWHHPSYWPWYGHREWWSAQNRQVLCDVNWAWRSSFWW